MTEEQVEPDSLWEKFQARPATDQLAVVLSAIPATLGLPWYYVDEP